jgi:hypothetical protein
MSRPGPRRIWALLSAVAFAASLVGGFAMSSASAADVTESRPPVADVILDASNPGTNLGTAPDLLVDNEPIRRFLMRFDVTPPAGKRLKTATLALSCINKSSTGGSIRLVPDTWGELTATHGSAPAFGSQTVATIGSVVAGTRYQVDLTAVAQTASAAGAALSIGVVSSSNDGADYVSREGAAAQRPALTIVWEDVPGATPTPTPTNTPTPTPTPDPDPSLPPSGTARPVLADASIRQSTPTTNYGTDPELMVDNDPVWRFLMRFDVRVPDGKVITSAVLSITCTDSSTSAGTVRALAGSWTENGVTWNNAPTFGNTVLASLGSVNSGTRYQLNLTSAAVAASVDGVLDIGVVGTSTNGADFASMQATSAAQRPTLTLVYGDPGEPTPTPSPSPDPDPDPEPGQAFDVGLIGDTPYSSSESEDLLNLRDTMNAAGLSYAVHVGDIKSGSSACSDSHYTNARTIFNGFSAPFIYTPGDNEWSDCDGEELERLAFIRQTFFPTTSSPTLGVRTESVVRQSSTYTENARWTKGGILFATIHTVGGSNGSGSERTARNAANVTWLRAAFDEADRIGARGVVVITHANWGDPFNDTAKSAFEDMVRVLEEETEQFGKPVVFVHGDTHHFRIDNPYGLPNFTRIEVHAGADDWVRLRVVEDSRVFTMSTMSG